MREQFMLDESAAGEESSDSASQVANRREGKSREREAAAGNLN